MRFEDRLRLAVLVACGSLAACVGATTKDDTGPHTGPSLTGLCEGATPPEDYEVTTGFVTVEPGTPCPDTAAAQLEVHGCTFLEWQGITCSFDSVATDQVLVNDGYGGHFADAATAAHTGVAGDPVDVCYYSGVFYLPPDHPTCGRPLLADDGHPLVAAVESGDGRWSEGERPDVSRLDRAEREAAGAFWLRSAALEHASVASFARCAADLMRFGAPPDLLRDTHLAAVDEVRHAADCFALASALLGASLGPGALAGEWPTPPATLADFAESVAREGCVGETLAALDAAARLAVAADPVVRAVLGRIVREESAHAALAWRTLAWALRSDATGEVRRRVDGVFAELRADAAEGTASPEPTPGGLAFGLLAESARRRAVQRAWDDVVGPAWEQLSG